jgi:hypothetical protein
MYVTVPLRSAAEIERLHTAAYRFAETRPDGLRPAIVSVVSEPMAFAQIAVDDEEAASAFHAFWSSYRSRRLDLAA